MRDTHSTGPTPRSLSPNVARLPLYVALQKALTERIGSGEWKPGEAIPNEADLAEIYGVSAGTVRKALDWMERSRLILRQQGRGTFVLDQTASGKADRYTRLHRKDAPDDIGTLTLKSETESECNDVEGKLLELRPGAKVRRIEHERHLVGRVPPCALELSVVPSDIFPQPLATNSFVACAQASGVLLGAANESISIELPPSHVAKALLIAQGEKVMKLERVIRTLEGRVAQWRIAYCLAELFVYKIGTHEKQA